MGLFKKKQRSDDAVAPDDADAMIKRGGLAKEAGGLDLARIWYEKTAERGALAYEAGDLDAARAWYEQAAKLDHPQAMHNLGVLARDAGDLDAARA